MKHTLKVTLLLLFLFLAANVIGLFVTKHYLPAEMQLPFNIQKPQFEEQTSYIPIFTAIIFATILALILIRFASVHLFKFWFLLSVIFTLIISFNAFVPTIFAVIFAVVLGIYKVFKPNFYIHNFTELFIYGALAAIFVPVLNVFSCSILLVLISAYDMIAVWKTKHMISMAKFQAKAKMFTGLLIPYSIKPNKGLADKNVKKVHVQEAILGGGDIGFPLLFSGVILKIYGFPYALIITLFSAIALFILFMLAEKKKFYPAMPFVTIGCFLGYLGIRLIAGF